MPSLHVRFDQDILHPGVQPFEPLNPDPGIQLEGSQQGAVNRLRQGFLDGLFNLLAR